MNHIVALVASARSQIRVVGCASLKFHGQAPRECPEGLTPQRFPAIFKAHEKGFGARPPSIRCHPSKNGAELCQALIKTMRLGKTYSGRTTTRPREGR